MDAGQVGPTFLMSVQLFIGGYAIVAAYRKAAALVVAPMQYSQIILAAVLGCALFGQSIGPMTALGTGIIVASGLFLLARSNGQLRDCAA